MADDALAHLFSGAGLLYRRGRGRDLDPRQPGGDGGGALRPPPAARRPAGAARRVHPARVPERQARSAAGRGGAGRWSTRCRRPTRGWRAASSTGALSAAVARLAAALRELQLRLEASIDFPDEGYHFIDRDAPPAVRRARCTAPAVRSSTGERRRGGCATAISSSWPARPTSASRASSTRSSAAERAIVTPMAGTTRDLVSEHVLIGDAHLRLVDTAGVRRRGRGGGAGGNPARAGRHERRRSGAGRARSIAAARRRRSPACWRPRRAGPR